MIVTRRGFVSTSCRILTAALAGAVAPIGPAFAQVRKDGTNDRAARDADRLILLGTQGGPNYLPQRSESGNALVVDGVTYLIDCGYGTLGALIEAGLDYLEIANVFLTHLHDDHTSDLAALLSHQWTTGRIEPTTVHGPHGTRALVEAAVAFGAANAAIRLVDEARSVDPKDLFRGIDIAAPEKPTEIFADERVHVRAVENTHYPDEAREAMPHRSVAYRFDTPYRSIAFSGDTAYSPALVELARGADVLVCETIEVDAMRRAFETKVAAGAYADNPEAIWHHIVTTHTSTEDAGRMAAEAEVGLLVLSHLVPGALSDLPDEAYIEGVRKTFSGRVVVGRDFMEL